MVWYGMKQRCLNPNDIAYPGYGGRGIKICERWLHSFSNFASDMGPRPPGTSIDRIDNNGNYEPGNCRWATRTEQQNNKRNNRVITHDGLSLTPPQWAIRKGINVKTIWHRLLLGWELSLAVSSPATRKRYANVKGRTHCKNGHAYAEYPKPYINKRGVAICRACMKDARDRAYAKLKAEGIKGNRR